MANVEHSALTGASLHEPKGVATASSGQVYVADGATSGSWTWAPLVYGEIHTQESDAATLGSIGTTAQTFPFANAGFSNEVTVSAASNNMTVPYTGIYYANFTVSFATVAAGDAGLYEVKIAVNGTPGTHEAFRQMSGSSDTGSLSTQGMLSLNANDVITVRIESDEAGNTDDINIKNAQLTVFLLKRTA